MTAAQPDLQTAAVVKRHRTFLGNAYVRDALVTLTLPAVKAGRGDEVTRGGEIFCVE